MRLRINTIDYEVEISGPGKRTEIFMQGCYKDCKGCFNPTAKALDGGRLINVFDTGSAIIKHTPNKLLTICGGEPILQAENLSVLIKGLKEEGFNILLYTGYYYEELLSPVSMQWYRDILCKETQKDWLKVLNFRDGLETILENIDILVDGPFEEDKKLPIEPGKFIGSSNQRVIDMPATLKAGKIILHKEENVK